MQVKNNSNIKFGAYFKNNQEFKQMMARSIHHKPEVIDKFVKEMPPHEVEIIEKNKTTNGEDLYFLHNNVTKQFTTVVTREPLYALNTIIKSITETARFWGKDKFTERYESLTNKQNNVK